MTMPVNVHIIKGNALELTKLEYEIIEFLSMNPEMVLIKNVFMKRLVDMTQKEIVE